MLRRVSKVNLLCYNPDRLPARLIILPALLSLVLYVYTGKKYERLFISSIFMCFFYLIDFIMVKKIGPIHAKKDNKKLTKGKKR